MMRLFSEKVVPTFTSSNLNILTVEDFQEIFFDVFEFEINGKKFIAEKVSKYKGLPVVDVPLVLEGKEFTAQFVLQRGKFEVLFNRDNSIYVGEVVEERVEPVIEYVDKDEEVEDIIFEKKEDILREIAQARQSAERYVEKLKQQKINEAVQYFDEKKKALDAEINESKKGLLDEFLSLVESVKGEFFEFNEKEKDKLSTFIEESICELSDQLVGSIEEKQDIAERRFNEQLNELATNILSGVLLKEISSNNDKCVKDINERFAFITSNLKTLLRSERDQIDENVNNKLTEFNDAIVSLEKTNIELNDQINKGDNRALSRIGNVKSQLEEAIDLSANTLVARVDEAEKKIRDFYDNKISLIEEKVEDLSVDNKQYFIDLVNESKQSLLNEIANIKVDVPNIVIEKSNGKQEVDLKGIKSELEKIIGTRFSNELQSLKRLIEMSSGGGSVAKQFAAGGTMDGTLNVTGQILSAGVDLLTIFAGGDIAVNTVVRSSSANWNNAYTTGTVYQVNSASYATIDYTNSKFFPLTGGTISGATVINNNLTVNGNLTATGITTFNNTVFSVTSALSVVHIGEGPAVWIGNRGLGDIASFNDLDTGLEVLHIGGSNGSFPNVGVKTSTPNKTLTVSGEISATSDITTSGKIYIQDAGNSDQWNSSYTNVQANSANWNSVYSSVCALSTAWVNQPSTQTIILTSAGTTIWSIPDEAKSLDVICIGAGGGGGSGRRLGTVGFSFMYGGTGGGGGGLTRYSFVFTSQTRRAATIIVGGGGSGGQFDSSGNTGNSTSFTLSGLTPQVPSTSITAYGGTGGQAGNTSSGTVGGNGGIGMFTGGGGQGWLAGGSPALPATIPVAIAGAGGGGVGGLASTSGSTTGGQSGSTPLCFVDSLGSLQLSPGAGGSGGSGRSTSNGVNGLSGRGYGGGGGGGGSTFTGLQGGNGGNGANGCVIIICHF